ncbi:uncharacterized protein SCHCODRAFT_02639770, partial [Schizophyllum commune H4-8]|uniref:uncharacterized protein n=1 Tax=Schizophyllum commune (strain H4-8 / FGSC 9210) TaxID=578458 RepID=UPI00215F6C4F
MHLHSFSALPLLTVLPPCWPSCWRHRRNAATQIALYAPFPFLTLLKALPDCTPHALLRDIPRCSIGLRQRRSPATATSVSSILFWSPSLSRLYQCSFASLILLTSSLPSPAPLPHYPPYFPTSPPAHLPSLPSPALHLTPNFDPPSPPQLLSPSYLSSMTHSLPPLVYAFPPTSRLCPLPGGRLRSACGDPSSARVD